MGRQRHWPEWLPEEKVTFWTELQAGDHPITDGKAVCPTLQLVERMAARGHVHVGIKQPSSSAYPPGSKSCVSTFPWQRACVAPMPDEPTHELLELISGLCLEAGRIMENESPALALTLPPGSTDIGHRLAAVPQAGDDIPSLATAADVLLRRAGDLA